MIEAPVYPTLPPALAASEPPEARGLRRDGVRLLVGRRGTGEVSHHVFRELPSLLREGDVIVVNTSATLPAAVPVMGGDLTVHFSTAWPYGGWLVELRQVRGGATVPFADGGPGGAVRARRRRFDPAAFAVLDRTALARVGGAWSRRARLSQSVRPAHPVLVCARSRGR